MSLDPVTALVNYGLAGVVIYLFWRILTNEMEKLRASMEKLIERIDRLTDELKRRP